MKKENRLLFISTNDVWGGSEELWVKSAKDFIKKEYVVYAAAKFDNPVFDFLGTRFINYNVSVKNPLILRVLKKLRIKEIKFRNLLYEFVQKHKPQLVIISQGNNIQSLEAMQYCITNGLRFITLTQTVTRGHFYFLRNENLSLFQSAYLKALRNFFVSENNLKDAELMLGIHLPNAVTTLNPCKVFGESAPDYPSTEKYKIALVGRLECYQKGYDLVLEVLNCEKWRERNVQFNIYGSGWHEQLIMDNIKRLCIKNISLHGFLNDVKRIWEGNHLLFMPSRLEGQALALIEAMYLGRAAVVTDVGGATELVQDGFNGFIAETPSVKSIDDALERAWQKKESWEEMGINARDTILKQYRVPAEIVFNNQVELLLS